MNDKHEIVARGGEGAIRFDPEPHISIFKRYMLQKHYSTSKPFMIIKDLSLKSFISGNSYSSSSFSYLTENS